MPPSLTEVRLSYKGIVMVCFCFTASVVCYVDRTNISVAIVAMARDYEWGDAQRSLVSLFELQHAIADLGSLSGIVEYQQRRRQSDSRVEAVRMSFESTLERRAGRARSAGLLGRAGDSEQALCAA